jgi:hypothetical protein
LCDHDQCCLIDNRLSMCLQADPCTYVCFDNMGMGILTVWVDDTLLFTTSDMMMEHMENALKSEWEVTDLGELTKIVGIKITQTSEGIKISQEKYIENVCKKEGMLNANPITILMDTQIKLVVNPDDNELNRSNSYMKLLGCLQFISNSTRPDISFAVNKLATYTTNLGLQHHGAIKCILQYLAGTKTLGIIYKRSPEEIGANLNLFHGFTDTAFVNTEDLKSTTGYIFLAAGGAIT